MTIEPSARDATHFPLPARVDTLEALRLGRRLQDAASQSGFVRVNASAVDEIGLAGIQLLALIKLALARDDGKLALDDPSPAFRARVMDAGMAPLLLGASAEPQHGLLLRRCLRFTDAALDYGREPIEALRRLREAGIGVVPILPDPLPSVGAIEADRLILRFDLRLPDDMTDSALTDALAEFGGDALIDVPSPLRQEAADNSKGIADLPADQQALKLERLMADVEELLMRHAAIAAHYPSLDRNVVAELKAMDGVLRSLQGHVIAAGMEPLGILLQRQIAADAARAPSFPGCDIEVEPEVVQPLLSVLTPLLARSAPNANNLSAHEAEGMLVIEMPTPDGKAALAAIEPALSPVRGRAAVLVRESRTWLRVELPRSLSMMEALIVRAGPQLAAIPVDRAIEILRPEPADLTSVGSGSQLMRFRDAYLPTVDLALVLSADNASGDTAATVVVVVQSDAGNFAIRVHEVTDHRPITIKALDGSIPAGGGVIGISFSAGGIALVLDVDALRRATLARSRSS